MGADASPTESSPGRRSGWKWWICGFLLLATTLNYMDRQALYQTSVRICNDLGLSNEDYGWLEFSFNLAYGAGAVFSGFIIDRASLRWVYAFIVFGWSLVGFATGFVTTIFFLFVCRILLGLFESANWPCGIMTVKRVLPPAQRSLGNGLFQSGTALGAIFTPLIVLACLGAADPELPHRTAVQGAGGGAGFLVVPFPQYSWQLTFRIIGAVGLLWVVLWLAVVRSRYVAPPPEASTSAKAEPFWALFRDRRFWLLAFTVVAVNVPWRSFVVWSPKFLQQDRGYGEADMQRFMSLFYVSADIGSIAVGLVTLQLVRRRFSLFAARLWTFAFSASLALLSLVAVHLPQGPTLLIVLLLIGFAVLGSFPTYFALSQDVSVRHQGKLTGMLGLINAIVMACLAPLQGWLVDTRKSFDLALGLAGLTPLLAVGLLYWFWPAPAADASAKRR